MSLLVATITGLAWVVSLVTYGIVLGYSLKIGLHYGEKHVAKIESNIALARAKEYVKTGSTKLKLRLPSMRFKRNQAPTTPQASTI